MEHRARQDPADEAYIRKVAAFIKEATGGMDVVYGGGLKADNAAMLASIPQVDGGLIALTRFAGKSAFIPRNTCESCACTWGIRRLPDARKGRRNDETGF